MTVWGITALSHDASICVIDGENILFAAHAERYSRNKNDPRLSRGLIDEAMNYGRPEVIAWYERPMRKKLRHVVAGQWRNAFDPDDLPRRYLKSLGLNKIPISYVPHHTSHAMAGVSTSGFDSAAVITADAIGEFVTLSIGQYSASSGYRMIESVRYPHSLGLLYSAFTRRCGLVENEEEYILMGMAAFGSAVYVDAIWSEFIASRRDDSEFRLRYNVHRGIGHWVENARKEDLAASIQAVTETVLKTVAKRAAELTGSRQLVFGGGLALNCLANSTIAKTNEFDDMWIFPNPGDAGSSLGAAAFVGGIRLKWTDPFLGFDIVRDVNINELTESIKRDGVAAVANGRAEFGPRALGNRSILADPRPTSMKDRVNGLKGRESFRPFSPVVREELAHKYFTLPVARSPYMQFTADCKFPHQFPAIVHVDGSSRVQTVRRSDNRLLYEVLLEWERKTGCPILLNTSLNGRGEPLVNTWEEAVKFGTQGQIRIF